VTHRHTVAGGIFAVRVAICSHRAIIPFTCGKGETDAHSTEGKGSYTYDAASAFR
jgi:hypothetical protein